MAKILTVVGGSATVAEALPDNPDGTKAGRSWSFATLADAQRQAAEFPASERTKLQDAIDAAPAKG